MDTESRSGPMVLNTSESGAKTELMGRVNSFMLTAIFMMVSGLTIRPTVSVFTNMLTEPSMKACGETISSTVRVSRPGLMAVAMRASTLSDVSMVSGNTNGMTVLSMWVSGKKIRSQAQAYTPG
jgi:hypothetical protein